MPVFSPLAEARFGLGLESIYEGYLLHYGRPRLFAPADADTAILLGDYLYAHGLVRMAAHGDVTVVGDLSELISLCAQLRASGGRRRRLGGHGLAPRRGGRRLEAARSDSAGRRLVGCRAADEPARRRSRRSCCTPSAWTKIRVA